MQKILAKREKIILYAAIALLIFSVGLNFIIQPILKKNDMLNKEISVTRAKLSRALKLLSQKDIVEGRYNKFFSAFPVFEKSEDTPVSILSALEAVAVNSEMRIIEMRPQAGKKIGPYQEAVIDLRTEGSIESYIRFIYEIDNSLAALQIKKIQLNAKPNAYALEGIFSITQVLGGDLK